MKVISGVSLAGVSSQSKSIGKDEYGNEIYGVARVGGIKFVKLVPRIAEHLTSIFFFFFVPDVCN